MGRVVRISTYNFVIGKSESMRLLGRSNPRWRAQQNMALKKEAQSSSEIFA